MKTLQTFIVENAKAIVLTVHGAGEHIGRYKHVAKWFNAQGISMVGGDLPGLGQSTEHRGHIEDFNQYVNKLEEWLEYIKKQWPNTPVFLFGHSMGGLIVLRFLEEKNEKLAGAILSSPAISIGVEIPNWQLSTAKILKKVWPTFRLASGIKPHQVSRDPAIVQNYGVDPLNYSKVSISWFFAFQRAIDEVWKKAERINQLKLPILFLQAGEDQLVNPNKAVEFVKKLDSKYVTFLLIPELYHEIFNEPEKEQYLELTSKWMKEKI